MARLITLIWLRLIYFKRQFHRRTEVADRIVGVILWAFGVFVSIALAITIGKLSARSLNAGEDVLRVSFYIEFYVFAVLALLVPLFIGAGGQRLGATKLFHFPMSRKELFALDLVSSASSGSHMLWYPAIVMVILNAIIRSPNQGLAGVCLVTLYAVILVVWSHALLLLFEAMMRQRSLKEIVFLIVSVMFMGLMIVPFMSDSGVLGLRRRPMFLDILPEIFGPLINLLPPSRLTGALVAIESGKQVSTLFIAAELALWIAVGCGLSSFVFSKNLLEGKAVFSRARSIRSNLVKSQRFDLLHALPDQLAAIVAKELRYILRSTTGKIAMLAVPFFVIMIGLAVGKLSFLKDQLMGLEPANYALYGIMIYGASLSGNLYLNAFAWEGAGMRTYFMNPVTSRDIVFGKNLGAWIFSLLVLVELMTLWSLLKGMPDIGIVLNGVLVYFVVVLVFTILGNFVSVRFPARRSISSLSNSASQIGIVFTFAALALSVLISGSALVLGLMVGGQSAQVVMLLMLVAALAVLYRVLLDPAAELFEECRESLIEIIGEDIES